MNQLSQKKMSVVLYRLLKEYKQATQPSGPSSLRELKPEFLYLKRANKSIALIQLIMEESGINKGYYAIDWEHLHVVVSTPFGESEVLLSAVST
jgi:hypothetical protein